MGLISNGVQTSSLQSVCVMYGLKVPKENSGRINIRPASHKLSRSESANTAVQCYQEYFLFHQLSGRFTTSVLMATLAARIAMIVQICLKATVYHPYDVFVTLTQQH